jgi:hypothetical protein
MGLILLVAGVATWCLVLPLNYKARTELHISVDSPNPLFPAQSPVDIEEFRSKQEYLIRDPFVLKGALRKLPDPAQMSLLKEQPDPLEWLVEKIKVEFPRPEFIHISLSGDQPEELTQIVTSVTESYLDNVVDREGKTRREELAKLKQIHDEFIKRTKNKRQRISDLLRNVGPIDEKKLVIQQQIDLEILRNVKKELVQVHSDFRRLRVELSLHPDWIAQVWPQYVVSLNCLPGPGLPINQAVVLLVHDDAHLLHQAEQETRQQEMREKLQFLEEMRRALLKEATDLDERLRRNPREPADLVEEREELAREEKIVQMAGDKILQMELEQDAPARVTPTASPMKADVTTTNETTRKWMLRSGKTLAGLGVFLLIFAALQFRAQSVPYFVEDSPTYSSSE